jgi:hypothetical protein
MRKRRRVDGRVVLTVYRAESEGPASRCRRRKRGPIRKRSAVSKSHFHLTTKDFLTAGPDPESAVESITLTASPE